MAMSMTWGVPLEPDQAVDWSVEQVALHLLRDFEATGAKQHRHNFLIGARYAYEKNGLSPERTEEVVRALAEAFDVLLRRGLLAGVPGEGDWLFVTREARRVLELGSLDGGRAAASEPDWNIELHDRIAERVGAQLGSGHFDLAAFTAMREVEIRVRELSSAGARDLGVDLMKRSFGPAGPLTDANSVKSEQEATMALFWGAIGVFKNPPSHRQVDYADQTIASEVVLFADLLLRMLDERAGGRPG